MDCKETQLVNPQGDQSWVFIGRTDVEAGFRKGRETRNQVTNIHWIIKKAREFKENIYFFFIDYAKVFVWITTTNGKFIKRQEYQTTLSAS